MKMYFNEIVIQDNSMIASNKLVAFYRSNNWVVVGRDAVREQNMLYAGEERRRITYGANFCMKWRFSGCGSSTGKRSE